MKNYRSTIIGFAVLIVLLTAGAAQSLSGSNTVFTDDIAPGQVYGSDIAANAVSGSKIYNNSITGADVNESTLAIKKVLVARVRSNGALHDGDAIGSSTSGNGTYTVSFSRDVAACSAFANVGAVPGSTSWSFISFASANVNSNNTVTVYLREPNGNSNGWITTVSSFHLMVVCP